MRVAKEIKEAFLSPLSKNVKESLGIEWIKTKLPSTVQASLLNAGLIDDPYYADNFEKIQWINKEFWLYKLKVKREKTLSKLVFHGVDYRYSIIFEDKEIAYHEGMFSPLIVDVSSLPEEFEILVKVHPNLEEERPYIIPPFVGFKKNMRFSMSYGWDFAPKIITVGIWDTVELIETDGVFIHELKVRGNAEGNLSVSFKLEAPNGDYIARMRVLDGNDTIFESNERINLVENNQLFGFRYKVDGVEPWWPWDQGEPKLYSFELVIEKDGNVLDNVTEKFGFITIKKKRTSFIINGRKVYLRGANWVPADSMLRLEKERYERLLKAVRELNANIIRVWGGGIRERKFFYELTDFLGIMVWQEFPFACEEVEISKRMLNLVKREATEIVKYLRNHPSLILWSGGNELNYRKHITLFRLLEEVVKAHNPEVPFQPVSPYDGDTHSWYVWHAFMPLYAYRYDPASLVSEFGLQSVPSIDTLKKFLPPDKIWPPNELWIKHKAELNKHYYYACLGEFGKLIYRFLMFLEQSVPILEKIEPGISKKLMLRYSKKMLKMGLEDFVRRDQFVQALGLKIGIEHFRVNREKYDGSLLWQFNEPWPVICWSIYDYFGNKKLAYHFVRMSFEPLQAFLVRNGRKLEIYLVNDTPKNKKGIFKLYKNGKLLLSNDFNVNGGSKVKLGHIKFSYGLYKTELIVGDKKIKNIYPAEFFYEAFKIMNKFLVKSYYESMVAACGIPK